MTKAKPTSQDAISPTENNPSNTQEDVASNPPQVPITPPLTTTPQHKQHNYLPIIIILTLLTIAGIGTSTYAFIQNANKNSEISDLKAQLNDLSNQPATTPDNPDEPNTDAQTPPTPNDNSTPVNAAEILAKVPENLVIREDDIVYSFWNSSYMDSYAMEYTWDLSNNNGSIRIYWDKLEGHLNKNQKTDAELFTDFGPSEGRVIDFIFSQFGNGIGDETFLFLMDDGTVEYVPFYKALESGNFRSYGKLDGIENVIKFYHVNANNPHGSGGYITTLAQRADGTYYNLLQTILKVAH